MAEHGRLFRQLPTFKKVLTRDANYQLKCSASFCKCCSLQCIIIFHVASIHLLELKHFVYLNVRQFDILQS